jgi:xanthine dehydrogenase accessory factor
MVLILGGDTFGSAIAVYLHKAGLDTVMALTPEETPLQRPICFSDVKYIGKKVIDGTEAVLIDENFLSASNNKNLSEQWLTAVQFHLDDKKIPAFININYPQFLDLLSPKVIIRSDIQKKMGVPIESAPLIIGLYPFHHAGEDCHFVIETRLNFLLGTLFSKDPENHPAHEHLFFKKAFEDIISPLEGVFIAEKEIGEELRFSDTIGTIENIKIKSPYNGQIWGLMHSGRIARKNEKLAKILLGQSTEGYRHFDFRHKATAGAILREVLQFIHA